MSAPAPSAPPTGSDTVTVAAAADFSCHQAVADQHCIHLPRLGHDDAADESAPTSSSSSNNNRAATAQSTRPPPVARLYRHALECILAFSDAKTLMAALRVSREWLAAVGSMRALALKVDCSSALVESASAPAMCRHVSDLSTVYVAQRMIMSAGATDSLVRHMPHLRRLDCSFPRQLGAGQLHFPAGLRELKLTVCDRGTTVAEINAAIESAGRLAQLESLDLSLWHFHLPICLSPLAALPLLNSLYIVMPLQVELSDEQVAELRALPRLQYLEVHALSSPVLRRLLAQPHDLQWQRLSLPLPLTDDDAALLPRLPSLTELDFSAKYLSSFDFLQWLPNLTSVHCSSVRDKSDAQLTAELQQCTNVTELVLDCCAGLTTAHLADLLPRLPRLRSLALIGLSVDSLSFLTQAPMTSQLTALRLVHCAQLPAAALHRLHELRGLRELRISHSFDEQMDPDCDELMVLRPPSAALPLLESFSFTPPRIASVQ